MNIQDAQRTGFKSRFTQLMLEEQAAVKQAGMMAKLLGAGKNLASAAKGKVRLDPSYAGASKIKLPGLDQAIAEQTLAHRQVGTAALRNRAAQAAKPAPAPLKLAPEAPLPSAAPAAAAAAPEAATAASVASAAPMSVADRVGRLVGGMNPGLGRRALAGPEFAGASSVNPADLGRKVLGRAGVAGGGAALAGGAYGKGQMDAAEEAKRRASQLGFMQRLAFLMNPNIVNQM